MDVGVGAETPKHKTLAIINFYPFDVYCAYGYIDYSRKLRVKGWVHVPSGTEEQIQYFDNDKLFLVSLTTANGQPVKLEDFKEFGNSKVPKDLMENSFEAVYEISNGGLVNPQYNLELKDLESKKFYKRFVEIGETVRITLGDNRRSIDGSTVTPPSDGKTPTLPKPDPFNGNYERDGKDYALLFATDVYDDKQVWPQLANPVSDAKKIETALKKYGFEVHRYDNPTLLDIGNTLKTWENKRYRPDDQLLVFFAGHGHYDNLDGYLAAKDSKGPDFDNTYLSYYGYKNLQARLDAIQCPNILLIVDACHSGTISPEVQNELKEKYRKETKQTRSLKETYRGPNKQRRIKEKVNAKTRWYLTSGGNEKVPDDSVFIKAFLKVLEENREGDDRVLTIQEIEETFRNMLDEQGLSYSPETGPFKGNKDDRGFLFIAPSSQ